MAADEIKDAKREKILKIIENLSLFDDDLMRLVFDKNILATELLLNIILQRNDLKVIEAVAQREYKNPMAGGRSITIDMVLVNKCVGIASQYYQVVVADIVHTMPTAAISNVAQ